jgi:predicted MPP superfamily phosphohydrolase
LPFIAIGLLILFGGHFLLYKSIISFFNLSEPALKHALLAIFFLLSVSFIISSIFVHYNQGLLARLLYIFSSSWLGLGFNLLLAAGLIGIIIRLSIILKINPNRPVIASVIFIMAVLFSTAGFWLTFHPRIKQIGVKIKNLPLEWQNKTIVQLSDVHLGHVYGPAFMASIVQKTNALKPDLILITGDLFDGMDGDLAMFIKPLKELQSKRGIYFVTGNHETYLGIDKALKDLNEANIRYLNNEVVNLEGLQLVGVNYPTMEDLANNRGQGKYPANVIATLNDFNPGLPSILMYHAPSNIKETAATGISFQLSGHTHLGQLFPFEWITKIIYGKYDYGLHTLGDFTIYTTNGIGTWGPPMRTNRVSEIVEIKLK